MNRTTLLVCALCATPALAEPQGSGDDVVGGEVIVIEGRAPGEAARDRDRTLGDAPFVTVVHAEDHAATASVADALATTAGAQRTSLGGLGAFASVSVRGAAPAHTQVLVDGVPLARIAAVTADLGRFALDAFGEVELYRGAVPLELGGAGVGGAVNLVTRVGRGPHGERLHASIGAGSFGARHAHVRYGDERGDLRTAVVVGYQGATGDYRHFTDNGTPLNPADDRVEIRRNNGFDQVDVAARAGRADDTAAAGVRALWKRQGLPGSVAQPALGAELATLDVIGDAHGELRAGKLVGRQLGYLLVETQALRDPDGELGLGSQQRDYLTLSGGVTSSWARALGAHRALAAIELRGDRFRDRDHAGTRAALTGTRGDAAAAIAADLAVTPAVTVTPAARLDVVRTAPTPLTEGPDAFADLPPRWDVVPSPRLSLRARLDADLVAKASAGYYVRLPTLVELFGDRGTILGSPELAPERGPSIDLGAAWAPAIGRGPVDRILVEASVFAARARDTIALVSSAGFVARAENVGDTASHGAELVGAARLWRALTVTASYTLLVARQRAIDPSLDDKILPRAPRHRVYGRAELTGRLAGRGITAWGDAAAQTASFLDRANFQQVPGRVLIGAGARVELVGGVAAALAVDNLADIRVVDLPPARAMDVPLRVPLSDLAGFPLPGRSFYFALDWTY